MDSFKPPYKKPEFSHKIFATKEGYVDEIAEKYGLISGRRQGYDWIKETIVPREGGSYYFFSPQSSYIVYGNGERFKYLKEKIPNLYYLQNKIFLFPFKELYLVIGYAKRLKTFGG